MIRLKHVMNLVGGQIFIDVVFFSK